MSDPRATKRTARRQARPSSTDPRGLEIERRASSIPPALVHSVFEVEPEVPKAHAPTLPPPPAIERRSQRVSGHFSKPPPPPRPSMHSHAALPETDDLDTRLSLIGVSAPSVLNAPSTETPMPAVVPARRSPPWLALGAGALLLVLTGVVLGARTRARPVVAEAAPNERAAAEPVVAAVVPAAPPVPELPTEPPGYAPVSAEPIPESAAPLPPAAELAPVSSLIAAQPAASGALRLPVQSELVARAPASAGVVEQLPVFDAAAASRAITAAVERSAACRAPTDPGGAVTATLTYAPSGRVTTALISGKFAGTAIGGCIAGRLRGAKVPAFSGDYTTVKRTFVLK